MRTQLNALCLNAWQERWHQDGTLKTKWHHSTSIIIATERSFSPDDLDIKELESLIEVLRQHFSLLGR